MIRNKRIMRFGTVTNHEQPGLNPLRRSAKHHGMELIVLGLGKPDLGKGTKITRLREYLASMKADEIRVYTDAWDSLFVASEQRFKEKFSKFDRPVAFENRASIQMSSPPSSPLVGRASLTQSNRISSSQKSAPL